MTSSRRGLTCLAALILALQSAWIGATPASAAGSSRTFKAIEFNFCGSACPDDTTEREGGGTDDAKAKELADKIKDFKPHVVFLNEICLVQLELVVTKTATATTTAPAWPMTAGPATSTSKAYAGADQSVLNVPTGFTAVDANRTADATRAACGISATTHARTFGNAILTLTSASLYDRDDFQLHSGEIHKALCATVHDEPYNTRVCVAHTDPNSHATAQNEINNQLLARAVPSAANRPLMIGGDLNLEPQYPELNGTYYRGADQNGASPTGIFQEADQCANPNQRTAHTSTCNEYTKDSGNDGNVTLDRKIDFVLMKQAYFGVMSDSGTTVNHSAYSDHGIFKATSKECSENQAGCN